MNILQTNLLILASAGSGKTYQLGNRVIGLIARGVAPERIVALTFTKKAAGEFAEAVLSKLAQAAGDEAKAAKLRQEISLDEADFVDCLARIVTSLPRLTFGTMDSFFSRVLRGFQYELGLTGGKFELIQGARDEMLRDELIAELLSRPVEDGAVDEFLHTFRRATAGKEGSGVVTKLREFITTWHEKHRSLPNLTWGPPELADAILEDWENQKHALAKRLYAGAGTLEYTNATQPKAFEEMVFEMENHTIGSGSIHTDKGLFPKVIEAVLSGETSLSLRYRSKKELVIAGPLGETLRQMVTLLVHCEMAAALSRTRAIYEAVSEFDRLCEVKLRRRGLLGFDDVKILMGQWACNEDARLRREMVDFRLDARYDHWLLDEFQDTSRADWAGLMPLVEEAASNEENTIFIVGDRKQAIYGWRGGEVALFNELQDHHGSGLVVKQMAESRRSCPEVLKLVNCVCGDVESLKALFGPAADLWLWEEHIAAEPLTAKGNAGEARVEIIGEAKTKTARIIEILHELEVGCRALSCGILVRDNRQVRVISDELRAAGFQVIEEGMREPAKDSPVGVALLHVLKWLANPADNFAWEVITMSPLVENLRVRFGGRDASWLALSREVSERGFALTLQDAVVDLLPLWSEFGRSRAGDILAELRLLDAAGISTAAEAAHWIERMKISQSAGLASVQVMTIHKAKGLGFDAVILPEIEDKVVPNSVFFDMAETQEWITQPPARWARKLLPHMEKVEKRWIVAERYEAFCLLYVALTRAKRGLYVLLDESAATAAADRATLANWLASAVGATGENDFVWQAGNPGWTRNLPLLTPTKAPENWPQLGKAVPRRKRTAPTAEKKKWINLASRKEAQVRGTAIHKELEKIGWIDDEVPIFTGGVAQHESASLLGHPAFQNIFQRAGRNAELHKEQRVEAIIDSEWISGVIDRLHVHRTTKNVVNYVEIIDFKTDKTENASQMAARYTGQMEGYRKVMQSVYPGARVACFLISTQLCEVIEIL